VTISGRLEQVVESVAHILARMFGVTADPRPRKGHDSTQPASDHDCHVVELLAMTKGRESRTVI
jgi:hypothetical protein